METNLNAVMKYFSDHGIKHYHSEAYASAIEKRPYSNEKRLEVNLSSEFTELIKQAARCNRFSSDVIYDIGSVNNALENWSGNEMTFGFGFRRDGVDGNSFIVSRVRNECKSIYDISKLYFAIYFMEIKKSDMYEDYYVIETNGYYL